MFFRPVSLLKCGLTTPKIAEIGNFWYKYAPLSDFYKIWLGGGSPSSAALCQISLSLSTLSLSLSLSIYRCAERNICGAGVIMLLAEHINVDFYPLFLHSVCICM